MEIVLRVGIDMRSLPNDAAEQDRGEQALMRRPDGNELLKRAQILRPKEVRPPSAARLPDDHIAAASHPCGYGIDQAVAAMSTLRAHSARTSPASSRGEKGGQGDKGGQNFPYTLHEDFRSLIHSQLPVPRCPPVPLWRRLRLNGDSFPRPNSVMVLPGFPASITPDSILENNFFEGKWNVFGKWLAILGTRSTLQKHKLNLSFVIML